MSSKQDFRALTALKGLFIFIIVFHNTFSIVPLFDAVPGVSFIVLFGGILGNSMFFILSGFLFAVSYRERIEDHTISFQDFLTRRLRKLYPMYLITNSVSFIIEILRYGVSAVNIEKIVCTLLLQAGGGIGNVGPYNSPTWFLCALFVCYVLYFCIAYYAKNSTQYYSALTIGVICGYTLISAELDVPFCTSSNGIAFMNFFLGCALAEIYPRIRQNLHRWLQPTAFLILLTLGYLMLDFGIEIICGDVYIAFAFAICPMILYLAVTEGPCAKFLGLRPFVYLGKISSSVFFWHLVVYYAFCDLLGLITGNAGIQEPQYIVYIILMVAWSAMFSRLMQNNVKWHGKIKSVNV